MKIQRIDQFRWKIPRTGRMNVPGIVFADDRLMNAMRGERRGDADRAPVEDQSFQQVANVACLPGIVGASLAMPDMHWGYGFPIGGVAAFDESEGVVSPGGVGYDIN
jgi:tRNA-splicing ligase RtcB